MHELSIVMGIIDIVDRETADKAGYTVSKIDLEIGSMAGIITEALDMAWDSAVKSTILKDAQRNIFWVEAEAQCTDCSNHFKISTLYDPCPQCGSLYSEIIKGKELRIRELEIEKIDK